VEINYGDISKHSKNIPVWGYNKFPGMKQPIVESVKYTLVDMAYPGYAISLNRIPKKP
jgi:hypothetical protein